jgi:hypothetical protein
VSDLVSRLKPRDRAACGTAEHGKQGLHQSYGAGYPDAADDRHFPILVTFRVEEDTPLPGRKSLPYHKTFLLYVSDFRKIKLLLFFVL